jgi:hypothetical protein
MRGGPVDVTRRRLGRGASPHACHVRTHGAPSSGGLKAGFNEGEGGASEGACECLGQAREYSRLAIECVRHAEECVLKGEQCACRAQGLMSAAWACVHQAEQNTCHGPGKDAAVVASSTQRTERP